MAALSQSLSWKLAGMFRLMGPIVDKELRVSSRRKTSYLLRGGYCLLLGLYVVSMWYFAMRGAASQTSVVAMSRMGRIGIRTSVAIVHFQFVATQLVAVLLLCTAIRDEIRKGTLNVLMTTPIKSAQIVIGKLSSGLLQLLVLLATSLPLLAVIRVFGGVPWHYVVSGLCMTLTAAVLTGSLALLLSIVCRKAHSVVLTVLFVYLFAFGALPALLHVIAQTGFFDKAAVETVVFLTNPFVALYSGSRQLVSAVGPSTGGTLWWLHCLTVLSFACIVLLISMFKVRRVAFAGASGGAGSKSRKKRHRVRPITTSPIIWREASKGTFGAGRSETALFWLLVVSSVVIVLCVVLSAGMSGLSIGMMLLSAFQLAIMIRLALAAAAAVAGEKEARTLPILLATPLSDGRIIRDKSIAVLRRNIFLLALSIVLYGILLLTAGATFLHLLLALAMMLIRFLGSIVFVVGSGIYFSARMRTTTSAVAATIGLYLVVTYLILGVLQRLVFVIVLPLLGGGRPGPWFQLIFLLTALGSAALCAGSGVILGYRAVGRLRENLF